MYNCQVCKKAIGPGIQQVITPVLTATAVYRNVFTKVDDYGNKKRVETESHGSRIVKELRSCPECAEVEPSTNGSTERWGTVFQETPAAGFKVALIYSAIEALLRRKDHETKRAERDFAATATPLNQWLQAHKEFVF